MRSASFDHLRSGGKVLGGPPRINVYPGGKAGVADGRHRITLARERGQKTIRARVTVVGPRGGSQRTYIGRVKI